VQGIVQKATCILDDDHDIPKEFVEEELFNDNEIGR
jgi:hypothetical protein